MPQIIPLVATIAATLGGLGPIGAGIMGLLASRCRWWSSDAPATEACPLFGSGTQGPNDSKRAGASQSERTGLRKSAQRWNIGDVLRQSGPFTVEARFQVFEIRGQRQNIFFHFSS
jgi:hypothetical protein